MKLKHILSLSLCVVAMHLSTALANVGDIAVFNNLGDSSLSITTESGSTPSVVNTFTNTVVAPVAEYELLPAGDGVKLKSAGKHLVMYNVRIDNPGNVGVEARIEALTHLTLENGGVTNELAYGRSQGFIRNGDGNFETVISGGTIIEADADEILRLHTARTDTSSVAPGLIEPGHTAIQLIKLDNSLDYLRLRRAANAGPFNATTFGNVTWDTIEENSGSAMSFTANGSDITLNSNGYYLVFANTHLRRTDSSATRTGCTGRMTLNGTQIEGTVTTTYLRGSQNGEQCDDGTLCAAAVIKASAGDVLRIQHKKESGVSYNIFGERTGMTIVKLADTADVIRLEDAVPSGSPVYNDLNQGANNGDSSPPVPVKFRTQAETPAAVFTHSTNETVNTRITVNNKSTYLFLGGYFDDDDGGQRICPNPQWSVNGTTLPYGETTQYSRNLEVQNNGNWLGMVSMLVSNDYVEMTSRRLANSGVISGDSLGLQGVDLATIAPAPFLVNYGPMVITTNSTAAIRRRSLFTRDSDTPASSLTYTLTSAPANADIYNDGTLLGLNGTFTQADIDSEKVTITAEDTIGDFDVFTFSVSDGGSSPSTGTFSIIASAGVATAADTGSVSEDGILTELTGGIDSVLTNDFGIGIFVADYDSTSTLGAAVTINSDGTFTYDPTGSATLQALKNGSSTNDTFTYSVEDFAGLSGTATVTITVTGTNDTFAAVADYIDDPSVTETGTVSLAVNLVVNDGITGTANGNPAIDTLMLNYAAEYTGAKSRWHNTGYATESLLHWFMSFGCSREKTASAYAGLSAAYLFDGVFGWGYYNDGTIDASIHDIIAGDPDLSSATFEFWVRPDPAALLQTNTLFETGGGTGIGIIIANGVLKAALATQSGVVSYDLISDPMGVLTDDITNEFFQVVLVTTVDTMINTLYVNGVAVDSAYHGKTDWDGGDGSGIGHFAEANHGGFVSPAKDTGYDTYYAGAMAAFRVYSAPLSDAQIFQNYQAIRDGATDIDGDAITVTGIYNAGGTLITGTGTPVTLASGAVVTLDSATGSFTYDPTGIPDIAKLWEGGIYLDHFSYQATDGNGIYSDAPVEIVVHGVSQRTPTTIAATEMRSSPITAGELQRNHQLKVSGLNPLVAFYSHPDKTTTSPSSATQWINLGYYGEIYNGTIYSSDVEPVVSGFGGIGYALVNQAVSVPSISTFATADQSWEVWFRPDPDASGKSVLLECGGNGNGAMIYYDADRNSVNVIVDGGADGNEDLNMIAEVAGVSWDDFNQVIAVINFATPGQPDTLTVYLNNDPNAGFNAAKSASITNPSGDITLISGTDPSGIGRTEGSTAFNRNYPQFQGAIAHVLMYGGTLSESQAATAYNAIRKQVVSVQGGATPLGASVALASGIATYNGGVTNDIPYGSTAADSFTYQFIDESGTAITESAPVTVNGIGSVLALNDTLVISADLASTNFNPLANDGGLGGSAAVITNMVVADYRDDFQSGTVSNAPADFRDGSGTGWQFLWNAPSNWVDGAQYDGTSGEITDTNSYIHLVWDPNAGRWSVNSDNIFDSGSPGEWMRLTSTGGHPGSGWADTDMLAEGFTNHLNRYPIAAYTVAADGYYSISDSLLYKASANNDGLDLIVLINDSVIAHRFVPKVTYIDFDMDLGELAAGDTVYVGIGPAATRGNDTFELDFSIVKRAAADSEIIDTIGSVANSGSSFTYSTDDSFDWLGVGQSVFETFTYTVFDNGELSTATVTIEVQGINDPPVAVNDSNATDEDNTVAGTVLGNDTDVDRGDALNLVVSGVQASSGNVGSAVATDKGAQVTLYSGGWYSYDPGDVFQYLAIGESTTDTFIYYASDEYGAQSAAPATVTVTITGLDDGVVAVTNAYALDEDETVSGNVVTDDTGDGADINIDTSDRLMISSVDTTGMLGTLTIGSYEPVVCMRGKVTPTGSPQTVVYDAGGGTFTDPVVFVTPAGVSDPEPGSIMISNVTDSSFVIFFKEQQEGGAKSDNDGATHTNTTELTYMVFDVGEYMLADGTRFEIGKSEISAMHAKNAATLDWDEVTFSTPFDAQPVVINQLQSAGDPQGELFGTRMNGTSYTGGGVTTTGFQIALEEYEVRPVTPVYTETVGWIAIERTDGTWDGNTFKADVKTGVKAYETGVPNTFNFGLTGGQTFTAPPDLLGCLAIVAGADAAVLRSGAVSATTFQLFMLEDTVNDTEQGHVDEHLTYLAIDGTGPLGAYNVTGGTGAFTYDPAGNVNPSSVAPIVETFTYTLRDQYGNESTATVSITVSSQRKGTLIILR